MLAAFFHIVPMTANARAWQRLMPEPPPGLRLVTWATWMRESVNGLLPVARIGGEVVAYRVIRRHVERRSDAAASLIADMGLSILSQASFGLFGLALLFVLCIPLCLIGNNVRWVALDPGTYRDGFAKYRAAERSGLAPDQLSDISRAFIDYSTSGLENALSHLLLVVFMVVYWTDTRGRTPI